MQGLDSIDWTIIISLWDQAQPKCDGALFLWQLSRMFADDVWKYLPSSCFGSQFGQRFPGLLGKMGQVFDFDLKRLEVLFPGAILDVEPSDLMDLSFTEPKEDSNSKRMLYKIWRANEIKRQIERTRSEKFDLVIRSRPDLLFDIGPEFGRIPVPPDHLFLPPPLNRENYFNDVFAYGSSEAMDRYAALFGKSIEGAWKNIHRELFDHLRGSQLRVQEINEIKLRGLEANPERLSLEDLQGEDPYFETLHSLTEMLRSSGSADLVEEEMIRVLPELEVSEKAGIAFWMGDRWAVRSNWKKALIWVGAGVAWLDSDDARTRDLHDYYMEQVGESLRKLGIQNYSDWKAFVDCEETAKFRSRVELPLAELDESNFQV
ncbi:MAG: hypothetical protein AAGA96_11065 [Verrucomicrobiota bacterium]